MKRRDFLFLVPIVTAMSRCARTIAASEPPQVPLFSEVAAAVGLNFRHVGGATGEYFMPEIMGAGDCRSRPLDIKPGQLFWPARCVPSVMPAR